MSTCDDEGQLYREVRRWVGELLQRGVYLPPRLVIDVLPIREELAAKEREAVNHNDEPLRKVK